MLLVFVGEHVSRLRLSVRVSLGQVQGKHALGDVAQIQPRPAIPGVADRPGPALGTKRKQTFRYNVLLENVLDSRSQGIFSMRFATALLIYDSLLYEINLILS